MSESEFWVYVEKFKNSEFYAFLKNYDKFDTIFMDIMPDFISKNDIAFVNYFLWLLFSIILKYHESVIFICGFDENQNYGSYEEFSVVLNIGGIVYGNDLDSAQNCDYPIIKDFAQSEGSDALLYGIDNEFGESLIEYYDVSHEKNLNNLFIMLTDNIVLDKNQLDKVRIEFDEFKRIFMNNHLFGDLINNMRIAFKNRILEGINLMPLGVLCEFGELLVHTTSIKQELSLKMATVGGNIDVVQLNVKDAMIWVKRKNSY